MVDRVLRWAGPLAVLFMMARVVSVAAQPPSNGDTWFHLRLGSELGWPWEWRDTPHWSTFGTSDFLPTQPLPELLMAATESTVGTAGVAWLYGFGLVAFLLVVYAVARARATALVAAIVTGLALAGAAGSLSARPQLVSLVLIPWVSHVWLQTEEDRSPRWWLIPLTWVWAMCHGFWIVGVLIGGCVVVGMVISGAARGAAAVRLAAVPAGSLVAAALTPLGPGLVLAPLTVNERADLISEWQRTNFLTPQPWPAVVMVLAAAGILAVRRNLSVPKGLLLVLAAGWVLLSVRTVDVGAIIAVPLLATALQLVVVRPVDEAAGRREVRGLAALGAVLLVVLGIAAPRTADEPGAVPSALEPQLDGLPSGTTVFNDAAVGGWLAWEHPDLNVVIDGLFDAYPVGYIERVRDATLGRDGWQQFVADTGARAALLDRAAPLVDELAEHGWIEVGVDEGYVLLESPQLRR